MLLIKRIPNIFLKMFLNHLINNLLLLQMKIRESQLTFKNVIIFILITKL